MEATNKNTFKAVDFMRQVRRDLSALYHTDKERFRYELKQVMADFLKNKSATKPK